MSDKRYTIIYYGMGYSDEVYYNVGHRLSRIFTDEAAAEKKLRKSTLSELNYIRLGETPALFNIHRSKALHKKVNEFIKGITGNSVIDSEGRVELGEGKPKGLSDDDYLELARMLDFHVGKVVELPDTDIFYCLWNPAENEPYLIHDECGRFLIYNQVEDSLVADGEELLNEIVQEDITFKGTYDKLSDSPELLKSLVKSSKKLKYNAKPVSIEVLGDLDSATLKSLNGLLKKPFYTIKEMSTKEVMKLEKKLSS